MSSNIVVSGCDNLAFDAKTTGHIAENKSANRVHVLINL